MTHIEGKIAAVVDSRTVVINRGSSHGVVDEDIFDLLGSPIAISDPDSGEPLGELPLVVARVRVSEVHPSFCLASADLLLPDRSRSAADELPLEPSSIPKAKRPFAALKVGSPAVCRKF